MRSHFVTAPLPLINNQFSIVLLYTLLAPENHVFPPHKIKNPLDPFPTADKY